MRGLSKDGRQHRCSPPFETHTACAPQGEVRLSKRELLFAGQSPPAGLGTISIIGPAAAVRRLSRAMKLMAAAAMIMKAGL